MDTITKGRLGYNLVEKEFLKRNFELYVPILENTKVDCITIKNGIILKYQIKLLTDNKGTKSLPVRKISHNQGEYKVRWYSANEIDFFIGVDLETEDLYIVPISFVESYSSCISHRKLQEYKNNFTQLEPHIGNSMSAGDDIGESLTANAEGTQ